MSSLHDNRSEDPATPSRSVTPSARRKRLGGFLLLFAWIFLAFISLIHRIALRIDEWIFPDLKNVRVTKPLFILGVPRSGTTLFHRLVASQKSVFTTPPLWELVIAPALCQKYLVWTFFKIDQALNFGTGKGPMERILDLVLKLVAKITDEVHPTDMNAPEEDTLGLIPFDGCFLRVLLWPLHPKTWQLGYFEPLPELRQKKLLSAYQKIVARHLYFRGQHLRLLSKNPGFTTWIPALADTFEDACFVGLRRSPEQCVPSQLSSLKSGMQTFGYSPSEPAIVRRFVDLLAHYWQRLDEASEQWPEGRFMLIEYGELMSSQKRVVLKSLQRFNYALAVSDESRLDELTQKAVHYRSRHKYQLSDFGLTSEQLNEIFFNDRAVQTADAEESALESPAVSSGI